MEHTSESTPLLVEGDISIASPTCCICLMEMEKEKGISCANYEKTHSICIECFSAYVSSLCYDEQSKLMKAGGRLRCPFPGCNAEPWATNDVRKVLDGDTLEKYIDILIAFAGRGNI